jgi:type IV secretory pathway VirB4 component
MSPAGQGTAGLLRDGSQRPARRRLTHRGLVYRGERVGVIATTAHAQAVYAWYAHAGLGFEGPVIGEELYGGGAFCFDAWRLYARRLVRNPNMLVTGETGAAKSALMKSYVCRQRAFGRRAEIIDRKEGKEAGGEWGPIVGALGGTVVTLRPGIVVNPLERAGATKAAREGLLRAVARVLTGRELTPAEKRGLSAALEVVDRRVNDRDPTIPDVVEQLHDPGTTLARQQLRCSPAQAASELRELALALGELSTGPLAGMFDAQTSLGAAVWENPVVSIDISQLAVNLPPADESRAIAIALLSVTGFLDARRRARQDGIKTIRVLDESWRALAVEGAAERYAAALKLARATGVQTALILHRLSDLSSVADAGTRTQQLARGLVNECATRVMYAQATEEEADLIADEFGLSTTERELLMTLGVGEALWRVGRRSFRVQHLLTSAEHELVQTEEGMIG